MVYWYYTTPKQDINGGTTKAALTQYNWRVLTSSKESANVIEDVDNRYNIGDEVFVKPPSAKSMGERDSYQHIL